MRRCFSPVSWVGITVRFYKQIILGIGQGVAGEPVIVSNVEGMLWFFIFISQRIFARPITFFAAHEEWAGRDKAEFHLVDGGHCGAGVAQLGEDAAGLGPFQGGELVAGEDCH